MKITRHAPYFTLIFAFSLFFFIGAPKVSAFIFSASPNPVVSGSNTLLTWDTEGACSSPQSWSIPATTQWGSTTTHQTRTDAGSRSAGPLTSSTVFYLDCGFGAYDVTVTIAPPPSPTVDLSASPSLVSQGGTSTLTWSSTNSTSCSAPWTTSTATSGTQVVGPLYSNTAYSITCTNGSSNATDNVTVSVLSSPNSNFSVIAGGTESVIPMGGTGSRAHPILTTS